MAMQVFNLRRTARMVSISIWATAAAFVVGGLWLHPLLFTGAALFGTLLLAEIYCRFFQSGHAVLRNFGIFGVMRYVLEGIGPEMRQYWIASDTEERPFNRRQRAEIYRYAKNEKVKSAAFGTQVLPREQESILHSMFPIAVADLEPFSLIFGEERGCDNPYTLTKPFMISGMSFGSLGENAIRALARGAKRAGIPINTGEGGTPKHHLAEKADVIFQLGTAKFGVRNDDSSLNDDKLRELCRNELVRMVEIKFSQGAKPGKGGLLPAAKVTREISELRGVPMGKDIYSPASHVECDTVENTVRFIRRVQDVSGLPVGIKFCLGRKEDFRSLVKEMKRLEIYPDYIAVDGSQGGTGAAPAAFLDHVGMPIFPALDIVLNTLILEGIRDRMKVVASGKLINPAKMIKALAHGADAVYSARGFMFAVGCIQALQCNTDHCPVGVATHDAFLQKGLVVEEKAQRVANYIENANATLHELLAATGIRSFPELNRASLYVPSNLVISPPRTTNQMR